MIDTCFLQSYLAFVIYKLIQPTEMTNLIRQISALQARTNHQKFKKSDYSYTGAQAEELINALKTQAELDEMYQEIQHSSSELY